MSLYRHRQRRKRICSIFLSVVVRIMVDDSYIFLEMEKQTSTKRKERSKRTSKPLPVAADLDSQAAGSQTAPKQQYTQQLVYAQQLWFFNQIKRHLKAISVRNCSGNSGPAGIFRPAKKEMLPQKDSWKRLAHRFITGGSKLDAPSDTSSTVCGEEAVLPPTPRQSPFPLCPYSVSSHKSCKLPKIAHVVKLWKKYETLQCNF